MLKLASFMDLVPHTDRPRVLAAMGIAERTWGAWKRRPEIARAVSLKALADYLTTSTGKRVTVDDLISPLV